MKNHLTDCLCIRVDSPTLKLLSYRVIEGQYLGISDDLAVHAPITGHVSRITLIPSEQQTIITLQTYNRSLFWWRVHRRQSPHLWLAASNAFPSMLQLTVRQQGNSRL